MNKTGIEIKKIIICAIQNDISIYPMNISFRIAANKNNPIYVVDDLRKIEMNLCPLLKTNLSRVNVEKSVANTLDTKLIMNILTYPDINMYNR